MIIVGFKSDLHSSDLLKYPNKVPNKMIKDTHHPYYFLLLLPSIFFIFPIFTFDWSHVDEIVFSKRQISVYLHKPAIKFKEPMEIDQYCPLVAKSLDDNFIDQYPFEANLSHEQVSEAFWIQPGGKYKPKDCKSRNKVAILIPVQNRNGQLKILAPYLHSFLNAQLIDYQLFVVELIKTNKFNKGALYNAGFLEINKLDKFDCVIFHDVDLLPESQYNIYSCSDLPRHLSVNVNSLRFTLPYSSLFGGVFSLLIDDFKRINGLSNKFIGAWGGEDDSLFQRLKFFNYTILRSYDLGYYTMLPHSHLSVNENRKKLIKDSIDQINFDGLSDVKYQVMNVKEDYLYTRLLISLISN